jgi:hypothetical protein
MERAGMGEKNQALGALRYLISRLDSRFIAKLRKIAVDTGDAPIEVEPATIPVVRVTSLVVPGGDTIVGGGPTR